MRKSCLEFIIKALQASMEKTPICNYFHGIKRGLTNHSPALKLVMSWWLVLRTPCMALNYFLQKGIIGFLEGQSTGGETSTQLPGIYSYRYVCTVMYNLERHL